MVIGENFTRENERLSLPDWDPVLLPAFCPKKGLLSDSRIPPARMWTSYLELKIDERRRICGSEANEKHC